MSRTAASSRLRTALAAAVPPCVVLVACVCAWQAAVWVFRPGGYLLPSPIQVAQEAWDSRATLARAAWLTGLSAAGGFAIAACTGVLAGSVLAASRFLMRGLYPIATLLQMVPLVAIAPLLVVWCGYGWRTSVASAAIVSVFPVLASTLDGMRGTDRGLVELFGTLRAGRVQRWWKLELPWAIPSIVTGLRVAAGLSVIGAIVGEFVGAFAGNASPVGIVILSALREHRTELVFAAVLTAAVVGFVLFGLVSALGWVALRRWHASVG
jgi:NitT/TauT family transport system permease protein